MPIRTITTHNPSLQLDWARFRSHSVNHFGEMQIDIVNNLAPAHIAMTWDIEGV